MLWQLETESGRAGVHQASAAASSGPHARTHTQTQAHTRSAVLHARRLLLSPPVLHKRGFEQPVLPPLHAHHAHSLRWRGGVATVGQGRARELR